MRSLSFLLLIAFSLLSFARINDNLVILTKRYGKFIQSDLRIPSYTFKFTGITVKACIYEGETVMILYKREDTLNKPNKPFTKKEIDVILQSNLGKDYIKDKKYKNYLTSKSKDGKITAIYRIKEKALYIYKIQEYKLLFKEKRNFIEGQF